MTAPCNSEIAGRRTHSRSLYVPFSTVASTIERLLRRRRSKSSGVLLKKDFGSVEKTSVVMEAPKRYRHAMAELLQDLFIFRFWWGNTRRWRRDSCPWSRYYN